MMSRKKWLLLFTGIFALIGCAVLAVAGYAVVQLKEFAGVVSCDEFQYDFLQISLPLSATVLDESCTESLNTGYDVTFLMSPDDLKTLQQQDPLSNIVEWQTDMSNSFWTEEGKQTLQEDLRKQGAQLDSILYGQFSNGSILLHVLIDTSDPQQYFVQYSASYVD